MVSVQMGFDRPLGGFHCTVTEAGGKERIVYCNLDDPCLTASGLATTASYFKPILARLGVKSPSDVFDAVQYDGDQRVGNKRVLYPDQV